VKNFIKFFFFKYNRHIKKLIIFNKKNLNYKTEKVKNLVLVDYTFSVQQHVPYSYLSYILSKKYNAKLLLFKADVALSFLKNFFFKFCFYFSIYPFSIFKSFGVLSSVFYVFTKKDKDQALILFKTVLSGIKNKDDILKIKIDNIVIGDLIYDHYLKKNRTPTIEIDDKVFVNFLFQSILFFNYWKRFFKTNKIKAVIAGHSVYLTGIICRLAIKKKIPVYYLTLEELYKLDKTNFHPQLAFKYLKKNFRKLSTNEKKRLVNRARERIDLRIKKNKIGVDMYYSKKSAWIKSNNNKPVLFKSNRIKILISPHCFFDSPHVNGKMLFPDFYEWINFLGKISQQTDYDWYVKSHPDYLPGNELIIKNFANKYNKFKILHPNTSHHQIIKDGINFVLTCYGTIGFEYAIMGLPVINASKNNPHINYNFNIHASSISNYRNILLNLNKIKLNIKKNEIYEYYGMRFLASKISYIFEDNDSFLNKYNYEVHSMPFKFYSDFVNQWTEERHKKIINNINNFIRSKCYNMQKKHTLWK
jgi:hypothetical protein